MYHHEHKIAQAEHAIYLARFNRPPLEGMTVRVPNIFDRIFAALKNLFTGSETNADAEQKRAIAMPHAAAK